VPGGWETPILPEISVRPGGCSFVQTGPTGQLHERTNPLSPLGVTQASFFFFFFFFLFSFFFFRGTGMLGCFVKIDFKLKINSKLKI
jgi:hypothetical protein